MLAVGAAATVGTVIARMWRVWTRSWDADLYAERLWRTAVRRCRESPGNCSAYLLRRGDGDRTEFVVLSFWESVDAVPAVGADMERALPCPHDDRLHVDPVVTHFQVREEGRGS